MAKELHIVSLAIPFPADYGGVIDIFYKLKALHQAGFEITLHCFEYGNRKQTEVLNGYCKEVYYYPRKTGLAGIDLTLPYIISSRKNDLLLTNLNKNHAPILFEGLHCTYYSNHPSLINRFKILRAHNHESAYYKQLAAHEKGLKKFYYRAESNRLKSYEQSLHGIDVILSISEDEYHFHQKQYPAVKHLYVPAFHAYDKVQSKTGSGDYCLFHGNLTVQENQRIALYLLKHIFPECNCRLIVAGKEIPEYIQSFRLSHVEFVNNPSHEQMTALISNAHINVLPAFQQSGMKLKLLHALFLGRHCVSNTNSETVLNPALHIAPDDVELISLINALMKQPFHSSDLHIREECLKTFYNEINVQQIVGLLNEQP